MCWQFFKDVPSSNAASFILLCTLPLWKYQWGFWSMPKVWALTNFFLIVDWPHKQVSSTTHQSNLMAKLRYFFMAGFKPFLTEFGLHDRLESIVPVTSSGENIFTSGQGSSSCYPKQSQFVWAYLESWQISLCNCLWDAMHWWDVAPQRSSDLVSKHF